MIFWKHQLRHIGISRDNYLWEIDGSCGIRYATCNRRLLRVSISEYSADQTDTSFFDALVADQVPYVIRMYL